MEMSGTEEDSECLRLEEVMEWRSFSLLSKKEGEKEAGQQVISPQRQLHLFVAACIVITCLLQQAISEENSQRSEPLSPHVGSSSYSRDNRNISSTTLASRRTQLKPRSWVQQHRATTNSPTEVTTNIINNKSESEIVLEKWQAFEKTVKKIIDGRMKKALPMFLRMSSDAKLSGECQKSIMALVNGVRSMKSWAFRNVSVDFTTGTKKKKRDTQWSSRRRAVTVVHKHLDQIVEAFNHLALDAVSSPETKSEAVSLLKSIQTFEFVAFTCSWQKTLKK
ncbi:hypothetical protein AVEN_238009-1 [Araneus ventricosus]|uniref:Uncharacterized protein n=1 Tax=Araneus ventricosus TaxID=182803 RepID=A0A4Y2PN21_ARAVE|nr:hypothetical protein AVEN_238009-1 [Araneus ventricosus]